MEELLTAINEHFTRLGISKADDQEWGLVATDIVGAQPNPARLMVCITDGFITGYYDGAKVLAVLKKLQPGQTHVNPVTNTQPQPNAWAFINQFLL
jgi:hypothetical protein